MNMQHYEFRHMQPHDRRVVGLNPKFVKRARANNERRAAMRQPAKKLFQHNEHVKAWCRYKIIADTVQEIEEKERLIAAAIEARQSEEAKVGQRIERIKEAFWAVCPIARAEIMGRGQSAEIARWRQALIHCLLENTGASLPRVGRSLNRDHTTCIHARRRVEEAIAEGNYFTRDLRTGHTVFVRRKAT